MSSTRKWTLLTFVVLAIWFSFVGFRDYNSTNLDGDLAELVNDPVRVLHGEMPYRDFWLLHPPGEVYVPAIVYKFAYSVNAILIVNVCISVLVGLIAYLLARSIDGSELTGSLAAGMTFFAGVPFHYIGYTYLHFYLLTLLVAACFLRRYLQTHAGRNLFFAGVAIGVAFLFRTYLTGATAAAFVVTVLIEAYRRRLSWSTIVRLLLAYGGGCGLVLGIAAVMLREILPEMWHAVMVDSLAHATTNRPPYGFAVVQAFTDVAAAWNDLGTGPESFELLATLVLRISAVLKVAGLHVLPFACAVLWLFCPPEPQNRNETRRWMLLFFLCWGGLTFVRAFSRGGPLEPLSQAATPYFFAIVLLGQMLWENRGRTKTALSWGLSLTAVMLIASIAQAAIVQTLERIATLRLPNYPVTAPHGTLVYHDSEKAEDIQKLLDHVLNRTTEADCIFVVPWNAPAIYALTGRRNPTFYDSNIDLFYRPTDEKQEQVCRALQEHNVKLIIGRSDMPGAAWDGYRQQQLAIVDAFIDAHYERTTEIGFFSIYERRPDIR